MLAALAIVATPLTVAVPARATNPSCVNFNETTPGTYACDVPAGISILSYVVQGAAGGDGGGGAVGGKGARIEGVIDVSTLTLTNQTLYLVVGAPGNDAVPYTSGGDGGGYSAVATTSHTAGAVVVAGGGGGGGGSQSTPTSTSTTTPAPPVVASDPQPSDPAPASPSGTASAAPAPATSRTRIYFDVMSAKLTGAAKRELRTLVKRTGKQASIVAVVGKVQPTNVTANDISLSKARAHAVAKYLRALGLKGAYSMHGAGRAQEMGAKARRVSIVIRTITD